MNYEIQAFEVQSNVKVWPSKGQCPVGECELADICDSLSTSPRSFISDDNGSYQEQHKDEQERLDRNAGAAAPLARRPPPTIGSS